MLKKIEPWTGTSYGKEAFIKNFTGVFTQWELTSFEPQIQLEKDGFALIFGKCSLKSKTLNKEASSPMAAIAHVTNGKIDKFFYLEDTLATAYTFKKSGSLISVRF